MIAGPGIAKGQVIQDLTSLYEPWRPMRELSEIDACWLRGGLADQTLKSIERALSFRV